MNARGGFQRPPELQATPDDDTVAVAIMRAILYAQFNPQKTLEQFINDRSLYRCLILTVLILSACG